MTDPDPLAAPESFRCPFCGGSHFLAMGHSSETIRLYESIEASLQDLGLGTDERVERARLRLARSIRPAASAGEEGPVQPGAASRPGFHALLASPDHVLDGLTCWCRTVPRPRGPRDHHPPDGGEGMTDETCPTCGGAAARGASGTGRSLPLKCSRCALIVKRCRCAAALASTEPSAES